MDAARLTIEPAGSRDTISQDADDCLKLPIVPADDWDRRMYGGLIRAEVIETVFGHGGIRCITMKEPHDPASWTDDGFLIGSYHGQRMDYPIEFGLALFPSGECHYRLGCIWHLSVDPNGDDDILSGVCPNAPPPHL